jgi:UDP-N-acetylmuramoyl-L-alanyl-D-glutamate--2,6-diaminopimelate ligase
MARSKITEFFYNIPGAKSAYHFLWAWVGARVHGHPSARTFVIGVTGTKGKTTTLELINAVLEAAGKRTALISSLRTKIGDESAKNAIGNSMPGRGYLQKFMKRAVRARCNYILIEVTSQGVAMHRHRFIQWNIGVLTNLAPEHIESHGSFENYRAAKLEFLKTVVREGGRVFLNRDDKNFNFFLEELAEAGPIMYSKDDEFFHESLPHIRSVKMRRENEAPHFLMSKFNEENIAVAVAIAKELGIPNGVIDEAILNFEGVPGRMEFITAGGFTGVVDYAHTPDSLEAAYVAAKPKPHPEFPDPRLICVLGAAGGGRDTWKRPSMGTIAAEHCDEIILTNEDPYDENPQAIVNEIAAGIAEPLRSGQNLYKILDREEAIKKAFSLARPGDVVIGTGKGSEDWIHVQDGRKIPWSERDVFERIITARTKES